jgi:GNAT superfamily N-acetyltransferase
MEVSAFRVDQAYVADGTAIHSLLWNARDDIKLTHHFYEERYQDWVRQRCDDGDFWVVRRDSEIVGAAKLSNDRICYLVVAVDHQGRGIGRLLVRFAQSRFSNLTCEANPARAVSVRHESGFPEGRERRSLGK